jgi:hypothetical protein
MAFTINILQLQTMPLESLVCDATFWSVTLESSFTITEALFTLIYDVCNTGITYDNCHHQSLCVYSTGYKFPPLSYYCASGRVQTSLVLQHSATGAQPVLLTKFIFALPFNPVISSGST